jgi:hypothetical protein
MELKLADFGSCLNLEEERSRSRAGMLENTVRREKTSGVVFLLIN